MFSLSSNLIVSSSAVEIEVRTLSSFNLHKRCQLISDEDLWEIWSQPEGPEENTVDRFPIDNLMIREILISMSVNADSC